MESFLLVCNAFLMILVVGWNLVDDHRVSRGDKPRSPFAIAELPDEPGVSAHRVPAPRVPPPWERQRRGGRHPARRML